MPQTLNSTTGSGSQTDGLVSGGNRFPAANTANTISWNGTVWSQEQDVPVAVYGWGASKATTDTTNQTIFCGAPGQNTTTVDWSFPPSTATIVQEGQMWFNSSSSTLKGYGTAAGIPAATWASGGSSNTNHANAGGAGTQTSALAFGSESSPYVQVEEYNGSSWSEVAELNVQGSRHGFGANAEAVLATGGSGGRAAGNTGVTNVESWNGSAWTEVGDLNLKREGHAGFGTYTAGIVATGLNRGGSPLYPTNVESWNGTAWTEVNEVNQGRGVASSFGLQTTGLIAGGEPAPANNLVETWDGTSWTEVSEINTNRGRCGVFFVTSNLSGLFC